MKQCKFCGKAESPKAQTCPQFFVADPLPKPIGSEIRLLGMVLFSATVFCHNYDFKKLLKLTSRHTLMILLIAWHKYGVGVTLNCVFLKKITLQIKCMRLITRNGITHMFFFVKKLEKDDIRTEEVKISRGFSFKIG